MQFCSPFTTEYPTKMRPAARPTSGCQAMQKKQKKQQLAFPKCAAKHTSLLDSHNETQYPITAPARVVTTSTAKTTEVAKIAPSEIEAEYDVVACACCIARADEARKQAEEAHQKRQAADAKAEADAVAQGLPIPAPVKPNSTSSNRRKRQGAEKTAREAPNELIHGETLLVLPGPQLMSRVEDNQYTHTPYSCRRMWNGFCNKRNFEICASIGECICYLTESVPKSMIACLDWVNTGKCVPREGKSWCKYAHPDLTRLHPDICANHYLTGICRFQQSATEEPTPKPKNSRNRGPCQCRGCHCVTPKDFPLLPGLTKKILRTEGNVVIRTELDGALAKYKAYLGYE